MRDEWKCGVMSWKTGREQRRKKRRRTAGLIETGLF
jgi:hypothetical protein